MKTTVTPEIKISVLELHNSCPVSAEIKGLETELEIYKKANASQTETIDLLKKGNARLNNDICSSRGSYNALSTNYDALSAKHAELEASLSSQVHTNVLLKSAYGSIEKRHQKAIDLLKIVRSSSESQVDVINDFII